MSKKLAEIRKKIDGLDDDIHDRLMQRADLVAEIAKEKKKSSMNVVYPAREAQIVRRLLGRHRGALPPLTVLGLWRALVGGLCMIQTDLKVVVACDDENQPNGFLGRWDMAKHYFGNVVQVSRSPTNLMAVASVRDREADFAVLPWPEDGVDSSDSEPWWVYIYKAEQDIRIVCALPYGFEGEQGFVSQDNKAMGVSKGDFSPSGEDHSCLVLEINHEISRARIVDELERNDLSPLSLHTKAHFDGGENSLHMMIVEGYVAGDDSSLQQIADGFDLDGTVCLSMGGYPVPPQLNPKK